MWTQIPSITNNNIFSMARKMDLLKMEKGRQIVRDNELWQIDSYRSFSARFRILVSLYLTSKHSSHLELRFIWRSNNSLTPSLVFAYSGTNNAEMLPSELHVPTTSSYNIPDVSRFRYLRISQRLPIMFPRDVLDVVCSVFGKCTLPTLHGVFHFYRIIYQQRS